MKIIAIGDIHGRNIWKRIVAANNFDLVVFIGDYFDTREGISPPQQIKNFKEILRYKKKYKEKVILLIGNHDYHYLHYVNEHYSGFQPEQKPSISVIMAKAITEGLLQVCYQNNRYLFTHAGVTQTWCMLHDIDTKNIEQSINERFRYKPDSFAFQYGKNFNRTGDDINQSPIWVRPNSLMLDRISGYTHIVGHTSKNEIIITKDVIFIDTLANGSYLALDNGTETALTAKKPPTKKARGES